MNWLTPSIIATFIATLILATTYSYLYYIDRKKYLYVWAASWFIYSTRYIFMYLIVTHTFSDLKPVFLISNQLSSLGSGVVLLYGTHIFIGKQMSKRLIIFSLILSIWIIFKGIQHPDLFMLSLPTYLFLGGIYIWTGTILMKQKQLQGTTSKIVGITFIIWGVHKADYPFLRPILWIAPYGYLLGAALEIIVAIGMILVYFEMTRKELKESDARFRKMIQKSPLPMVITDKNQDVEYYNDKFIEVFGYTLEDISTAEKWWATCYPDETYRHKVIKSWEMAIKKAIANDSDIDMQEWDITVKNGSKKSCEFYMVPIGEISLVIMNDISERKKMEREREVFEFQRLQSQKLEAIGTLAGGIAHDFNNMLGVISGNASFALSDTPPGTELYDVISDIQEAVRQAQSLTQQLLTFAKGGAPVKKASDLNQIIKETAEFILRGENSRCEFMLPDDLWITEVDPGQLNQTIGNLVINANQSMPEGGVIQIKTENTDIDSESGVPLPPGRYVKITITDQGIGIPQRHISKIFDPYFSTKQKGHGLGLATTYSIIKKHGGHVTVESQIEKSTTFTIYLPATLKQVEKEKKMEKICHEGQGNVLIMDDEEPILKMSSRLLNKMGYKTTLVSNGWQAVETYKKALAKNERFEIVILDLTIPGGMGGKQTMAELLKLDPTVKAIVSSGYSNDPVMANYKAYGFSDILPKPYGKNHLAEIFMRHEKSAA